MKVLRMFYTHHILLHTGKFEQEQKSRDFQLDCQPSDAKQIIEDELGRHYDESWKDKKGFAVVSGHTFCDPISPKIPMQEQRITEMDLFPPMEVRKMDGRNR